MGPSISLLIHLLGLIGLGAAATASAELLCIGQDVAPGADGRMLGHLPYAEASAATLVAAPPGFALGTPCLVNRDMVPDLVQLLAAARAAPGVGASLRAISCFRTIARQRAVFCSQIGPRKRCADAVERARAVGPPGYSEHATGYAIDFGTRPSPACADVSACFASTPAGRWLIANAPDYGFELSFPPGNAQGVTWEPWHWRWVGVSLLRPGAATARQLFARARASFPAFPSTPDTTPFAAPASPALLLQPGPVPPPTPLLPPGAFPPQQGNAPTPSPAPTRPPRLDPPLGG